MDRFLWCHCLNFAPRHCEIFGRVSETVKRLVGYEQPLLLRARCELNQH